MRDSRFAGRAEDMQTALVRTAGPLAGPAAMTSPCSEQAFRAIAPRLSNRHGAGLAQAGSATGGQAKVNPQWGQCH